MNFKPTNRSERTDYIQGAVTFCAVFPHEGTYKAPGLPQLDSRTFRQNWGAWLTTKSYCLDSPDLPAQWMPAGGAGTVWRVRAPYKGRSFTKANAGFTGDHIDCRRLHDWLMDWEIAHSKMTPRTAF